MDGLKTFFSIVRPIDIGMLLLLFLMRGRNGTMGFDLLQWGLIGMIVLLISIRIFIPGKRKLNFNSKKYLINIAITAAVAVGIYFVMRQLF